MAGSTVDIPATSSNQNPFSKHHAFQYKVTCFFEGLGSPSGCRHEDFLLQRGSGAFPGLHSNWVTDGILACARPSEKMLDDGLADRFRSEGIQAILNLEETGEHPWCGPGIVDSGFSYHPGRFTEAGVAYHHLPWEDLGCPPFPTMLAIVQLIRDITGAGGKVAIHCHAGLGRTGLVIACYLVFAEEMSPSQAIVLVRSRRPGSVQTFRQAKYVTDFQKFLFPERSSDEAPLLQGTAQPDSLALAQKVSALAHFWNSAAWSCWDSVLFLWGCCSRTGRSRPTKPDVQAGP